MMPFLKNFYYPSRLLADSDFKSMCEKGKILEQDERGAKVIQLTNGQFLKIFRMRRLISGARIYSYARRFCRNASRLNERGIHTVKIVRLYHFEKSHNSAVLYEPLPGETLRDVVKHHAVNDALVISLAKFLSKLHQAGVHFHSLHTGNVVRTPEGGFGLIDVSDLSIFPWALSCNTRVRSFRRLCKYKEEIQQLGERNWILLQEHYFSVSRLSQACENKIRQENRQVTFHSDEAGA